LLYIIKKRKKRKKRKEKKEEEKRKKRKVKERREKERERKGRKKMEKLLGSKLYSKSKGGDISIAEGLGDAKYVMVYFR
jgi:hypothetical protein